MTNRDRMLNLIGAAWVMVQPSRVNPRARLAVAHWLVELAEREAKGTAGKPEGKAHGIGASADGVNYTLSRVRVIEHTKGQT